MPARLLLLLHDNNHLKQRRCVTLLVPDLKVRLPGASIQRQPHSTADVPAADLPAADVPAALSATWLVWFDLVTLHLQVGAGTTYVLPRVQLTAIATLLLLLYGKLLMPQRLLPLQNLLVCDAGAIRGLSPVAWKRGAMTAASSLAPPSSTAPASL
jgi:hypothetical protein